MSDSFRRHGLYTTSLLCSWDFPGKSTGVGGHFLLQGIFPTQGLNPGLPHCGQTLYPLSHRGSHKSWRLGLTLVCVTAWWVFSWVLYQWHHNPETLFSPLKLFLSFLFISDGVTIIHPVIQIRNMEAIFHFPFISSSPFLSSSSSLHCTVFTTKQELV